MVDRNKIAAITFILLGITLVIQTSIVFYFITQAIAPLRDLLDYLSSNIANETVAASVSDFSLLYSLSWAYLISLLISGMFSLLMGLILLFERSSYR